MKISNVIEGYWLDKQIDFSPHTVKYYKIVFRRLVGFLSDMEFEKVTADDIRRFLVLLWHFKAVRDSMGIQGVNPTLSRKRSSNYWLENTGLVAAGKIFAPITAEFSVEPKML